MRTALVALTLLFPCALGFTGTVWHGLNAQKDNCESKQQYFRRQLSPLHKLSMKESDDSHSRRDFIFSTAASTLMASALPFLSQVESVSAQIPGFDTRGERPAGLGPIAGGRFLSLCSNENCVSTSEGSSCT